MSFYYFRVYSHSVFLSQLLCVHLYVRKSVHIYIYIYIYIYVCVCLCVVVVIVVVDHFYIALFSALEQTQMRLHSHVIRHE